MKRFRILTFVIVALSLMGITQPAAATSHEFQGAFYTVRLGDTLWGIAARYGSSVGAIMNANGLSSTVIHPGKTLVIPSSGSYSGSRSYSNSRSYTGSSSYSSPSFRGSSDGSYIVQRGDNLSSIAASYGVSVSALMAANGLSTTVLRVGQRLTIPSGSASPSPPPTTRPTSAPRSEPVVTPMPTPEPPFPEWTFPKDE